MADVEEECLALLLAVVADVDAGGDLLRHDIAHRRLADAVQFRRIDRLAARAADVERVSAGGRGRLPVWVVRMRSWLRSIGCRSF